MTPSFHPPHRKTRSWSLRASALALAAVILAGCVSYAGRGLVPGRASADDVTALMGPPAMRWADPDGSQQWAYPRGPEGTATFMVFIGSDGRLRAIVNALDDPGFDRIRPGMTETEVLRVLGPPASQPGTFFRALNERVIDWRHCDRGGRLARFGVRFDAATGLVRTTYSQPEFIGWDSSVPFCGRHD